METHLRLYVVERRRADNGEADEENVGLGVGQRPQPVVILLSGGIPQSQADGLAINHDICRVVVEAGVELAPASALNNSGRLTQSGCTRRGRRSLCRR